MAAKINSSIKDSFLMHATTTMKRVARGAGGLQGGRGRLKNNNAFQFLWRRGSTEAEIGRGESHHPNLRNVAQILVVFPMDVELILKVSWRGKGEGRKHTTSTKGCSAPRSVCCLQLFLSLLSSSLSHTCINSKASPSHVGSFLL